MAGNGVPVSDASIHMAEERPAILSLQTTIFVRFYLKWNVEIESGKCPVECRSGLP